MGFGPFYGMKWSKWIKLFAITMGVVLAIMIIGKAIQNIVELL